MERHKFSKNPKVRELALALFPVLQKWVREDILKPIWDAVPQGEGYGRRENYPKYERSIQYDEKHCITITIDLNEIASAIETGRKAGKFPPVAALQRWIVWKRIIPRKNNTIEQLNYLIRRKIAREGTDPKNYLQTQIDKTQLPYEDIDKVVDEYFAAFTLLK